MCLATKCVDCGHEELTANAECQCGCHFKVPESLQVKNETTSTLRDRIAALEAENAKAQARLAMVMAKVDSMSQYPDPEYVLKTCRELQDATATAVEAFIARVKAEGAAEELKRIYTGKGSSTEFDPEYLLRRAGELGRQLK